MVSTTDHQNLEPGLEERLALVSRPDYEGAPMTGSDYRSLLLVAGVLPIVLLVIAWVLL
jgi:hypothetical protein